MSVWFEWDNPDRTILRWTFEGCWHWEEVEALGSELHQALDSAAQAVDYILDFSGTTRLPCCDNIDFAGLDSHPRTAGMTVAVGMATHAQVITRISAQLRCGNYREQHVHFVPTVEFARAFIDNLRQ